ncbi:MAG: segregation/condensation protein A [Planctomycetes bacterium]|nr:segregation/condensation protein A [Planctomycetota bacterium]
MIAPNEPQELPTQTRELNAEFRVRLEDVFTGPLDLLLHLVKEHEVEVTEVSIARVCDDFLKYVRALATLDLTLVGDYLVVAATLLAIKSRALIPTAEPIEIGEDLEPGDDLVKRLLQYRRVREASRDLQLRGSRRELLFSRGNDEMAPREPDEIDLSDVGAWDLLAAFSKVLREVGTTSDDPSHRIGIPDRPVSEFVRDVARILLGRERVPFDELFEGKRERGNVIGTFLAVLELAKQGAISVEQTQVFGSISITRAIADPSEFSAVVEGIIAGDLGEPMIEEAQPVSDATALAGETEV